MGEYTVLLAPLNLNITKDMYGFPTFGTRQCFMHKKEKDIHQIIILVDISAAIFEVFTKYYKGYKMN